MSIVLIILNYFIYSGQSAAPVPQAALSSTEIEKFRRKLFCSEITNYAAVETFTKSHWEFFQIQHPTYSPILGPDSGTNAAA